MRDARGVPMFSTVMIAGFETAAMVRAAREVIALADVRSPRDIDVRAIAAATGVTFGLDVILNRDKEIVAAFGGDLPAMHAAACAAPGWTFSPAAKTASTGSMQIPRFPKSSARPASTS